MLQRVHSFHNSVDRVIKDIIHSVELLKNGGIPSRSSISRFHLETLGVALISLGVRKKADVVIPGQELYSSLKPCPQGGASYCKYPNITTN